MSNVDEFYEYAKNNFLNLLKKNNVHSGNEEKANEKKRGKEIRVKGMHDRHLSDMRKLKRDELNDKESYDKKCKDFLLKRKSKGLKRSWKGVSASASSDASATSASAVTSVSSSSVASSTSTSSHTSSPSSHEKTKRRKREKHRRGYRDRDKNGRKRTTEKRDERKKRRKEEKIEEKRKNRKTTKCVERERTGKKQKQKEKNIAEKSYLMGGQTSDSQRSSSPSGDETKRKSRREKTEIHFSSQNEDKMKTHCTEKITQLNAKLEIIIAEKKEKMLLKNALNKNLVDCKFCIDSNSFSKINKLNIISISEKSYICYYNYKNVFLKDQLFISPIEHTTSVTNTNFDIVQDMRNHMKSLIAMLEESNKTCIFVEFNNCFNASIELISLRKTKHTYVNCYIIPMELLEKAKIYFKKNMEDINSLYRENKQLIITKNKYAPYNVLPKQIPYVSVNFSLVETYIQVIENNYDYINMCKCIFTDLFKKDKFYKCFQNFQQYVNAVEAFKSAYSKYDWTTYVN
ncbi:debranching enzyme-associated ribonuclease, putative [Plasmodium knowlesi strain H]|uniref:Debranching enzyme-associated ribonuclease, putative n=3 Tax=Plasmodium knowlesi TaxID=5850 RepID=A0A5K1U5P0_PLAKH|nr:debranching enzyme-associated ribonuclease, putative [Plasmodium knowlesi strain H]OTN64270.1 putative Debranching enzyme-associated ribonuclease [Plasmodium knowlesi]CAA9990992.1 debranching enzyme-associated ribonuclease, putative [Plasmodium knowlesi strain H]SBO20747.1 debranching enzyme-associated ribonuclease, putative [Plasmodium knowlesi strain H]SBO21198.1 debranching enzyme-associated ribonuclease, putative [Plasmodium knowlesi strain H]VVS80466.1 debranching enzyme-associated rib|eukprot:XP_002262274.1 hypothetical protein, conserved in Plasmodium species [Plasmodium knowlesi strain H]